MLYGASPHGSCSCFFITLLVYPVVPVVQFLLLSLSDFSDDEPECPQTHLKKKKQSHKT